MYKRSVLKAVLVVAVGGVVWWGGVASADPPEEWTDLSTFPAVNPCTGENQVITETATFREHPGHNNNFVLNATFTIETSDGYSGKGVFNLVYNGHVDRGRWSNHVSNGEGSKYKVTERWNYNPITDELKFDEFSARCLGGV